MDKYVFSISDIDDIKLLYKAVATAIDFSFTNISDKENLKLKTMLEQLDNVIYYFFNDKSDVELWDEFVSKIGEDAVREMFMDNVFSRESMIEFLTDTNR